jgi:F-type H+-transporting ATPase subunit b
MAAETEGLAHSAGADAAAPGMPQLDFTTFPNQMFWLLVTLAVIYLVLTRVAIPRIATVLAERRGTIANDLATAEELKIKAQEAEEAYERALAEARAEAQKIIAEARAEIQKDLDAANARAEAEIAARVAESETRIAEIRDTATENVRAVAQEAAVEIARAVLPMAADAGALANAVDKRMEGRA